LVLGITFKENCPDVRNTKAVDVIGALKEYGVNVTIYDPWANENEVLHEYGLKSTKIKPTQKFDAIILTVSHNDFKELDYFLLRKEKAVLYDVKNILGNNVDGKL
jgi:UDP-N-acetyl-D-galactosamine dehydrogenase